MPRGGKRAGAGRPAGTANRDTAELRAALSERCVDHVATAIAALADVAENSQSDAARVSAACAILDRTFGRPLPMLELNRWKPPEDLNRRLSGEELERELIRRGLPTRIFEE